MKKTSWDWILLCALVLTLPFERLLTIEAAGFTLKFSYLVATIYVLYQLFQIITGRLSLRLRNTEWFIIGLVAWAYLSSCWSLDSHRTMIMATLLLLMAVTFFVVSRRVDETRRRRLLDLVVYLGLGLSIFAILQFVAEPILGYRAALLRYEYGSSVFGFPRPQATFLEPLYFANFLIWPIFLQLRKIKSLPSCKNYSIVLILLTAFLLTLSRGAFAALLLGLAAMVVALVVQKKLNLKFILGIFGAGVASLAVAAVLVVAVSGLSGLDTYWDHALTSSDLPSHNQTELLKSRDYSAEVAQNEIKSHLWLGLGYDAFGALPQYQALRQGGDWQTVNNEYLGIIIELGIVGLALFVICILLLLRFIFAKIKGGENEYIFYLGAVIAVLFQYLTFSSFHLLYLWVMLAVIVPANATFLKRRVSR